MKTQAADKNLTGPGTALQCVGRTKEAQDTSILTISERKVRPAATLEVTGSTCELRRVTCGQSKAKRESISGLVKFKLRYASAGSIVHQALGLQPSSLPLRFQDTYTPPSHPSKSTEQFFTELLL
jgi:hypothetical protein